jgi:hypothetical protein
MFIAANIVCCRLRHQDAQCTHRYSNKLVGVTILQSVTFFLLQIFMYWEGGGGTNCSLCPSWLMGQDRP